MKICAICAYFEYEPCELTAGTCHLHRLPKQHRDYCEAHSSKQVNCVWCGATIDHDEDKFVAMHLECRIAFLQHCDTTEIDPDNLHVRGSSLTVMETMSRLQECVIAIRHLRQQQGLSDGTLVDAYIEADIDSSHSEFITTMAKLSSLTFGKPARPSLSAIIQGGRIHVAIDGTVDISAFKVRVQKQLEDKQKSAAAKRIKLDNPGYIAKAKPELVDETRKLLAEDDAEIERLKDTLKELG